MSQNSFCIGDELSLPKTTDGIKELSEEDYLGICYVHSVTAKLCDLYFKSTASGPNKRITQLETSDPSNPDSSSSFMLGTCFNIFMFFAIVFVLTIFNERFGIQGIHAKIGIYLETIWLLIGGGASNALKNLKKSLNIYRPESLENCSVTALNKSQGESAVDNSKEEQSIANRLCKRKLEDDDDRLDSRAKLRKTATVVRRKRKRSISVTHDDDTTETAVCQAECLNAFYAKACNDVLNLEKSMKRQNGRRTNNTEEYDDDEEVLEKLEDEEEKEDLGIGNGCCSSIDSLGSSSLINYNMGKNSDGYNNSSSGTSVAPKQPARLLQRKSIMVEETDETSETDIFFNSKDPDGEEMQAKRKNRQNSERSNGSGEPMDRGRSSRYPSRIPKSCRNYSSKPRSWQHLIIDTNDVNRYKPTESADSSVRRVRIVEHPISMPFIKEACSVSPDFELKPILKNSRNRSSSALRNSGGITQFA